MPYATNFLIFFCLFFVSCSTNQKFKITQFHLRNTPNSTGQNELGWIRAEKKYHLYGILDQESKNEKLGQHYTMNWNLPDLIDTSMNEPVLVATFQYRQPATGRTIKTIKKSIPASIKGKVQFQVTGDSYLKNGRVLAWKASLAQENNILKTEQSFLWD